ncbi:(Fe-S)-binding protein [Pseudodesulfovibrio thermohalotolerans]|uniref:(Fe-S)-binding protein n=1 Tax=Pseudodesulfovibrio thermohalotolerans TaxID=2880651 RepID=UPI00244252FF|nr:(Fe-S)-binding protein [Pseudodesulfovibrio thermohalotolerans]WFS62989.1 (Fe-S)-binding protein [Pseudodesulfovibrio thermohalotolerans]
MSDRISQHASHCILCGKCLQVCPLLRATGREELGPRSKSDLCRVLAEDPGRLSEVDAARLAGLCLGCGRCREVCSQGQDVPGLVAALRGAHPNFRSWLWKTWLTRARQLWSPGSKAAGLIPERFRTEKLGPMLKMLAGMTGGPGLDPFLTPKTFPDTYRGERMLLFAGCTANYVQGRWLMAALRLLDGLGADILPDGFVCCGSGLKGAGFADEAGAMAERNVAVWREAGRPRVAVFCASCLAGLAAYDRFESDEERAQWAESLLPLSVAVRDIGFVISDNASERIGYHHPCHAGKGDPDRVFLRHALGDRLIAETDRECCGFGGVMRLAAPGLTEPVNRQCWDALRDADMVLSGCSACLAQLSATAPDRVKVGHWLETIG